ARGLDRVRHLWEALAPSRTALASQDLSVADAGLRSLWLARWRACDAAYGPSRPSSRTTAAQDADLVLVDDYASGRHARLFPQGTRWFLEDLGSTNGTYVNGAPVTRAVPVGPGTAIRIGKTVMELEA
ncbi:FHA domain-containing protein, partial [Micrococcus luteus]|uniref:FHA domain-containing protein n=1 Tax=Micrococcus luteus TaxID=1270 RepID=UPI0020131981